MIQQERIAMTLVSYPTHATWCHVRISIHCDSINKPLMAKTDNRYLSLLADTYLGIWTAIVFAPSPWAMRRSEG